MIEFLNVTKLYGPVIGINDCSLTLAPGAYGLLGPNGSGKTTLINLICGQLRPTLGDVAVFEQNPWQNNVLMSRIGICPTVELLVTNVTGLQWVQYLVELYGYAPGEAQDRAEAALVQVGLEDAMHRSIGGYSLGMRQRTKLAQAFAHDPDLLILDEPFNGLDPIARHQMTEFLQKWIAEGRSLILASHLLYEVEVITPAFLLISGGRILATGTRDEVHSMLAGLPNEITLRTSDSRRLARWLLEDDMVQRIEVADNGQTITLATAQPLEIYQKLPGISRQAGVEIHELHSLDESLQSLFRSLMRIHRGEVG